MRLFVKWIFVIALLGVFFIQQFFNKIFRKGPREERHKLQINHRLAAVCLKILGLKLTIRGEVPTEFPLIIVGNHLSWLDPILLMNVFPTSFVTSTDVESHSFTGSITKMGGCRFVRRSASGLRKEMETLHEYFSQGLNLTFYPEATTGDGTELLPFKPALFDLSLKSGTPVAIAVTKYKSINGKPVDKSNKENVFYFGEVGFMEHLNRVLRLKSLEAEILVGPVIDPIQFVDRKEMSAEIRNWIEWGIENESFPDQLPEGFIRQMSRGSINT